VGLGLYYNWKLGLVCTALFPLLLLGTFFEMKITLGVDTVEKSAFEASAKLAIEAGLALKNPPKKKPPKKPTKNVFLGVFWVF
jgi:hypothetical protein